MKCFHVLFIAEQTESSANTQHTLLNFTLSFAIYSNSFRWASLPIDSHAFSFSREKCALIFGHFNIRCNDGAKSNKAQCVSQSNPLVYLFTLLPFASFPHWLKTEINNDSCCCQLLAFIVTSISWDESYRYRSLISKTLTQNGCLEFGNPFQEYVGER